MSLDYIHITNFRNLRAIELKLSSGFNFFLGDNGSGKTSILEAVYFLTHGRSFRTSSINRIIHHDATAFTLFGMFSYQDQMSGQAGITRYRNGDSRIKVNGADNSTIVDLVNIQPLLLINPFTFHLLDAGPLYRRQFIDWGLFHVEHQFLTTWRKVQRILKQRNAALKYKDDLQQAKIWNTEFVASSKALNAFRQTYLEQLQPIFLTLATTLTRYQNITLHYYAGWDDSLDLAEVLDKAYIRDSLLGYTQYGPQKADIIIKCNNVPAVELLSRGEQKLLVYALKLAQGMLLQKMVNKNCIYLIDDLAAELDSDNQKKLFEILHTLNTQVLVTGVESISNLVTENEIKVFQVKEGQLKSEYF